MMMMMMKKMMRMMMKHMKPFADQAICGSSYLRSSEYICSWFKPAVMYALISTPGGNDDKDNGRKAPKTPPSGRVCKKGKMRDLGDKDLVVESGGG